MVEKHRDMTIVPRKMFGDDGCVLHVHCGSGFTVIYMYQHVSNGIL